MLPVWLTNLLGCISLETIFVDNLQPLLCSARLIAHLCHWGFERPTGTETHPYDIEPTPRPRS